jgi:hypothetical protein
MRMPVVASLLLILGACKSPGESRLNYYPDLERALFEFQGEQQRFLRDNPVPQTFEFADDGKVMVRELSLDGYPGNTYVRCKFIYQNTTGRPVPRAWVSLDVLDAQGHMVASQVSVLIIPTATPIHHGHFFADELRTQTMDAHLQPGWKWRLTCKAEAYDPADIDQDVKNGWPTPDQRGGR